MEVHDKEPHQKFPSVILSCGLVSYCGTHTQIENEYFHKKAICQIQHAGHMQFFSESENAWVVVQNELDEWNKPNCYSSCKCTVNRKAYYLRCSPLSQTQQ